MISGFFQQLKGVDYDNIEDSDEPSHFVLTRRDEISLKIRQLNEERTMLDALSELSTKTKIHALFGLLDRNQDGAISVSELAEGLRLIMNMSFEKSIDLAVEHIDKCDDQQVDGKTERSEFQPLLKSLAKTLNLTVVDLTEHLILEIMICPEKTGELSRYDDFRKILLAEKEPEEKENYEKEV